MADEGTPNVDPTKGGTPQESAESTTPITGEGAGAVPETGATPNVDVKEGREPTSGRANNRLRPPSPRQHCIYETSQARNREG